MKQKISLFVMTLILVLPIAVYAIFKAPQDSAAIAASYGKPTVIEFSSPLCSECQKLKKVLYVVEPKYSGKVVFNKINAARMDRSTMKAVEKYNVKVVPTTIFIDKSGNMVGRAEGSIAQDTLCDYLDNLLK